MRRWREACASATSEATAAEERRRAKESEWKLAVRRLEQTAREKEEALEEQVQTMRREGAEKEGGWDQRLKRLETDAAQQEEALDDLEVLAELVQHVTVGAAVGLRIR